MKRDVIVGQIIKEGFTEKTLVNFSDKQLSDLHERIVTTTKALSSNPDLQKLAADPNKTVEVKETEKEEYCDSCDCVKSECKCEKDKEKKEINEWINALAEENFHSFTSKNEIMELITTKLNESDGHEFGPNVKTGHNGLPEFMSYDSIAGDTKTAPAKPKVDPGTKPSKPKTPFQPGPRINPKPKALKEDKK